MRTVLALLAATAIGGAAQAKTITVTPAGDAQESIQAALIDAKPGDVVELAAGRYVLTDGLSLDVDNVSVRGAGPDKTVLSFKGQSGAGEGLLVTSNRVLLTGFAVEDTKGDGIKAKGVDRITFADLRVEWTGGPKVTNGAYGVYPVSSTNVLVERVMVRGASDAGIYVGQSKTIVVRDSVVEFNVAGIEIENSMNADVYGNTARKNAGGILVFDLPNLPQMGGHSTRIYNNRIIANDTPNFAAMGTTVAEVPTGTGVMVMANRNVHIFDNDFADNQTAHVMVIAYRQKFDDTKYNPLPRDVAIGRNRFGRGGWDPRFPGGKELAAAVGGSLPPVVWDGASSYAVGDVAKTETVRVTYPGKILTLGLTRAGAPMSEAKPTLVDATPKAETAPTTVALPADQPRAAR